MPWHTGADWSGGDWIVMTLTMVLFWGAFVALLVTLMRHFITSGRPRSSRAEEVLAERFARGEIDEDEFRSRQDLLNRS